MVTCATDQINSNLGCDTVANCLKYHSLTDKVNALKHAANIFDEKEHISHTVILKSNNRTAGCNNKMHAILNPTVDRTSFEHLISELKDTSYDSYWNKELSQSRDKRPLLPSGLDLDKTTFGMPTLRADLKDVVNPPKSYLQVLDEADIGHENYKKSHNSYWEAEQKTRKYDCPFSLNTTFGAPSHTDIHGRLMKACMQWSNNNELSIISEKQALYRERKKAQLGKSKDLIPPEGMIEFQLKKDTCSVQDLLKESDPSLINKILLDWIAHINKVRMVLKGKNIHFMRFYKSLKYYDQDKSGWLNKDIVYKISHDFGVTFNRTKLESLLEYLEILKNNNYDIKRFTDILNCRSKFPTLPVLKDIPLKYQYYGTSTEAAFKTDSIYIDNSKLPIAGLKYGYTGGRTPNIGGQGCRAHYEHLGTESTVKSALNPSLQTNYGLSHRDYLQYRTKDQLKYIFQKVTNTSDDHFEFLWKEAQTVDDGNVNVQIIRDLIKKYAKL